MRKLVGIHDGAHAADLPAVSGQRLDADDPVRPVDDDRSGTADDLGRTQSGEVEPCPRAHLSAMLAAAQAIRERAEAALGDLTGNIPDGHAADGARLRHAAVTTTGYARDRYGGSIDTRLHADIEARLDHALQLYYRLGQVAAMPSLVPALDQPTPPRTSHRRHRHSLGSARGA